MDDTLLDIASAMSATRRSVSNTMHAAADLEAACRQTPELAAKLRPAIDSLYALADVARDVERDVAGVHAAARAET